MDTRGETKTAQSTFLRQWAGHLPECLPVQSNETQGVSTKAGERADPHTQQNHNKWDYNF